MIERKKASYKLIEFEKHFVSLFILISALEVFLGKKMLP